MIDLRDRPAFNGGKAAILPAESGLPGAVVRCRTGRRDPGAEGSPRGGPLGRLPAIVDHVPADGGAPLYFRRARPVPAWAAARVRRDGRPSLAA